MNEENTKPSWETDLQDESQKVFEEAQMSQSVRSGKLYKWAFRQLLTIALVYWFWDKPWIKYLIWAWVPLALLSLGSILFFNDFLKWRMRKLKNRP